MSETISPSQREARMDRWRQLLAEQAAGHQSISQFCLSHNINSDMFYYWRKKLRAISVGTKQQNEASRFIPVAKRADLKVASPRIILPNGVTIDLGNGLSDAAVKKFLLKLCGVDLGGVDAKP